MEIRSCIVVIKDRQEKIAEPREGVNTTITKIRCVLAKMLCSFTKMFCKKMAVKSESAATNRCRIRIYLYKYLAIRQCLC